MRQTKAQKEASEIKKRAWKTRRKLYGKKGHEGPYNLKAKKKSKR